MMTDPVDVARALYQACVAEDRAMAEALVASDFHFTNPLVVDDGKGGISHAQLTLGGGMIMLGTAREDAFGRLQSTPAVLGGTTRSTYIVVADAVCARAMAAGAEIIRALQDEDYGGRAFSCRDPEGQLWNFGTCDPWQKKGEA